MVVFAGSGGHNSIVQGANSPYGKEHEEARRFLNAVANYVVAAGGKFVNCSDEVGRTQDAVWNNAGSNHLRVTDSTIDLQFHLNATPGGTGCEVWLHPTHGNREVAAKISKAMANAFGLRDRGLKFSTELGWINKTKTGLLPEICFIDNEMDMQKFRANFDKAAKAVAEVIIGKPITGGGGIIVEDNGYKLVATGGIGFDKMKETAEFLNTLGYGAALHISGKNDGLFSIRTERRIGSELDKITAWLDNRPGGKWWYQYE